MDRATAVEATSLVLNILTNPKDKPWLTAKEGRQVGQCCRIDCKRQPTKTLVTEGKLAEILSMNQTQKIAWALKIEVPRDYRFTRMEMLDICAIIGCSPDFDHSFHWSDYEDWSSDDWNHRPTTGSEQS